MEAAKQRFEALVAFRQRSKGHSGQQVAVLSLYKKFLRVARVKDQKTEGDMAKAVRQTFRERRTIPITELETIEFYLAQGERQLERLKSASVSSMKFVSIKRDNDQKLETIEKISEKKGTDGSKE